MGIYRCSGVGPTLLSAAFEVDFDLVFFGSLPGCSMRRGMSRPIKSKSKAADKSVRSTRFELLYWALGHHRLRFFGICGGHGGCCYGRHNRHTVYQRASFAAAAAPVVPFSENHFAGCGLQDGGDRDVDSLADHLSRVVYHHHGSVVEIGHALVVLLAFLQDENSHGFAR